MKFKVGQKVVNKIGIKGTVQEVLKNGCFVNYGDYADFEYFADLKKFKLPTARKVWQEAEQEQRELKLTQEKVNIFCELLVGKYEH